MILRNKRWNKMKKMNVGQKRMKNPDKRLMKKLKRRQMYCRNGVPQADCQISEQFAIFCVKVFGWKWETLLRRQTIGGFGHNRRHRITSNLSFRANRYSVIRSGYYFIGTRSAESHLKWPLSLSLGRISFETASYLMVAITANFHPHILSIWRI